MKLATKLTWMMLLILLLVGSSIGFFGYRAAYNQLDEAAGIELVGCANITTGLLEPDQITALTAGDKTNLSAIQDRIGWINEHKPIFKEAFILSLDGKILAADKNLQARGYKAGDTFYFNDEDKKMISEMKHSTYSKVYNFDGISLKTGYGPIYQDHDPTKPIIALMAINFDGGLVQERTLDILIQPFISAVVILVLAIISAYVLIRRMVSPLSKLSRSVNHVANGDLMQESLLLSTKDEIGTLARDFNEMKENLVRLITEVNDTSVQVASSSEQLSASAQETNRAGEHNVNITMELAEGARIQLRHLEGSYQSVQEMSNFISGIAENADQALKDAMNGADKAKFGRISMDTTTTQMGIVSSSINEMSDIINSLIGNSKEIEGIVAIISGIAAETNLLALNAAIEAARAGEEGRGFAVVANSVRKLAERSGDSANQIAKLLGQILMQMEIAGDTMERSTSEMQYGIQMVASAENSFSEIENAVVGMAAQSSEISNTVQQLMLVADALVSTLQNVVGISDQTAESAESMSASSQEQLAAMQEIESSSAFLSSLADKLQSLVERFKIY